MDEVMMVPVNELKQLENYYKGQITENALLNKAGRLAAEQHLILKDTTIPPSIAVNMTKPLASETHTYGQERSHSVPGNRRTRRYG